MSYSIEHGKRVLELKTNDERFPAVFGSKLLYVSASADNNVSPRHFDWEVFAINSLSEWAGEVQLPMAVWKSGYGADGGSIKPWGKNVSGLSYVKGWKDAVKNRIPVDGWRPRVALWFDSSEHADKVNAGGAELFKRPGYDGEKLYAAFKRLFPKPVSRHDYAYVADEAGLLDAIYLYQNREVLPVKFYISDKEGSEFFKRKELAAA